MRVILVGPSNRYESGISAHTEKTAIGLAANGVDVGIILLDKVVPKFLHPAKSRENKKPKTEYGDPRISVLSKVNYHNFLLSATKRYIQRFNPNFILIQWWSIATSIQIMRLIGISRSMGIPIVLQAHETFDPSENRITPLAIIGKKILNRILEKTDVLALHNGFQKNQFKEIFCQEDSKIVHAPFMKYDQYGEKIDRDIARDRLGIKSQKTILFFGLIRDYKGLSEFIDEYAKNSSLSEYCLLISGEFWDGEQEIRDKIDKISDREILLNSKYVDAGELSLYFSAADCLILPYKRSSQSGVASIAISYGLPIVAFDVGGLSESIGEYPLKRLSIKNDFDDFTRQIKDSMSSQPNLDEWGQNETEAMEVLLGRIIKTLRQNRGS